MRSRPLTRLPCLLAGALLFAGGGASAAPSSERGFPLIQTYEPALQEAGTQSFGITRDPRGVLYIANINGVLVYDGAWWRLIPVGKGKTAFRVASDAEGRVAVGGNDEIGYLRPAADGTLGYVSLVGLLPPEQRRFGQVLRLEPAAHGFVFTTVRSILTWDGTRVATVATSSGERPYPDVFRVGADDFCWTARDGISRLEETRLVPVPGGDAFRGRRVDQILPANGGLLVSVRGEGLFLLKAGTSSPFSPQGSRWAAARRVLEGLPLPDGRWALGSVLGGVLLLRPDGEVDQVIDSMVGLPDDFVSGLVLDREGALWISLNNGLARVEVASPLSVIDRRSGLQGIVYALARHHGVLWLGTPAGLFTLGTGEPAAGGGPVRALPAPPGMPTAVWSLLPAGDDLLVGTAFGVYQAHGGKARLIPGTDQHTTFALMRSGHDPERVWMGTDGGISALRREGARWRLEGTIADGPGDVRTIVEGGDGTLWYSTNSDGVVGVELPAGWPGTGKPRLRRVRGLEENAGLLRIGDRILAASDDKVLRLDEAKGELVADPDLASLGGHGQLNRLAAGPGGEVWLNTTPPSMAPRAGRGWARERRSLVEIAARDTEILHVEPDGVVWLATDKGLYRYETTAPGREAALPAPLLAQGTAGGRTLFSGVAAGARPPSVELPPYLRRLRLEFAPLSFRAGLRYQTRLDPVDADWSGLSPEPFTELTRLPPGDYTFHVRTLGPNHEMAQETSWPFRVRAPWYQAPWAFVLWIGLALAALTGYARLRSRALRQRAARLEARVAEQTLELRHTVEELRHAHSGLAAANARLEELSLRDELTGIANRRHLQQVLDAEWDRARRLGTPVAFILLDLDFFKLLNDTRGHREGDLCLQSVAAHLDKTLGRSGDLVARYGGEELAVLLPDTDLPGARELAERLRGGIERLAIPHAAAPLGHLTASFGVASMVPVAGQRPEILVEAADRALYRAKTEGKNRVSTLWDEGPAAQLAAARAGA
ncbi:MAG TPA: diguanylate cyclase [Thermoanaerobaculia bacterium]|jgi:diguanylate cyclase (GGDEF)-like protein|nr:diguanylate cyclase [Thermoanaerobaculia bacterium]